MIGLLATSAVDRNSMWPVYVLPLVVGCLLVGSPLRAHRIGRSVGLVLWLGTTVSVAFLAAFGDGSAALRAVWTIAFVVPLVALATIGASAVGELNHDGDFEGLGVFAIPTVVSVVASAAWWLTTGSLADHFVQLPDRAAQWLSYAAIGGVLVSAAMSLLAALTLSFTEMNTSVVNPLRTPRIATVRWQYSGRPVAQPRRQSFDAQLAWRLLLLGQRLRQALVDFARRTVNIFLVVVGTLQRLLYRLANWLYRRVRLACRRAVYVVTNGVMALFAAMWMALAGLSRSQRVIIAYLAAIVGAIAARHVAEDLTRYLIEGPLFALVSIALWSVVGIAACVVMTERLSQEQTRPAIQSQLRFLENASPNLAILVVILGWMVGLIGTFWHGPIGIGWVTTVGTSLLIALAIPTWLRMAREAADEMPDVRSTDARGAL